MHKKDASSNYSTHMMLLLLLCRKLMNGFSQASPNAENCWQRSILPVRPHFRPVASLIVVVGKLHSPPSYFSAFLHSFDARVSE